MGRYFSYLLIGVLLTSGLLPVTFAQDDEIPIQTFRACRNDYNDLMHLVDTINAEGWTTHSQSDYTAYKEAYVACHNHQIEQLRTLLDQGATAIKNGNYLEAITIYQDALQLQESDTLELEERIISMYLSLAREAYQRAEYETVLYYLDEIDQYGPRRQQKFQLRYLRALYAAAQDDYPNAQKYAQKAQSYALSEDEQEEIAQYLDYVTNRATAPTNDPLSYQQPWLEGLRIMEASSQVDNPTTATVAIIDNGVDTAHPDLQGRIRTNGGDLPGNRIDDDDNGYVDDTHGYNFFDKNSNVDPYGDHGTQIAGIIGAQRNNGIGVAGITEHVELMPIVVCDNKDCLPTKHLGDPIRYAVDNGADIINMSLVSKSGTFNPALTKAIEYATEQGVVVIMAAGNGTGKENQKVGINTTTTTISPVCNEGSDKKRIIGVGAANETGEILGRSNYGTCVDLYTYGEKVVTTSTHIATEEGRYLIADGTSFSAPIIAGIVTLGFNQFGKMPYQTIYDALVVSSADAVHPDAVDYLAALKARHLSSSDQEKVDLLFAAIDQSYSSYLSTRKIREYTALLDFLDAVEPRLERNNSTRKLALLYAIRSRLEQRLEAID